MKGAYQILLLTTLVIVLTIVGFAFEWLPNVEWDKFTTLLSLLLVWIGLVLVFVGYEIAIKISQSQKLSQDLSDKQMKELMEWQMIFSTRSDFYKKLWNNLTDVGTYTYFYHEEGYQEKSITKLREANINLQEILVEDNVFLYDLFGFDRAAKLNSLLMELDKWIKIDAANMPDKKKCFQFARDIEVFNKVIEEKLLIKM